MNIRDIRIERFALKASTHRQAHSHTGHAHFWQHALSRRQFVCAAAGAVGMGAALGSGLWWPRRAVAKGASAPVPIPSGFQAGGKTFHVFPPGLGGAPLDAEPSTITDFNGFIGLAFIDGEVTQTDTTTGVERTLPFLTADMRFMKGTFRGTDGRLHRGAFALVWIDVYDPSLGNPPVQIHDLNPGILPSGLFWTIAIPADGIEVHLGKGSASMEALDVPITDYGNFGNALFGGGPTTPGFVSFTVRWSGVDERLQIRNDDPVFGGFAGEFIRNSAQMEWTATVGNFQFVSAPLATSSSTFAEIGHERNGSFFSE